MKKVILGLILLVSMVSCSKSEEAAPLPNPVFETLMPSQFIAKFKTNANSQMVDVWTLSEFNEGHRKEAILIDVNMSDFDQQAIKLLDKSKPVFLYCRSGNRSGIAAKRLQELGFLIIYNLNGGFVDIKEL